MNLDPENILLQILNHRGLSKIAAQKFLHPDYVRDLRDPYDLPDMSKAVERLARAQKSGEKVVIYGDYDIDGLSATAMLLKAFTHLGLETEPFIPSRYEHGYGLNDSTLADLAKAGFKLVVTVDCGTTAVEPIAKAKKLGLDIIVTDHHEPGEILPSAAVAVVNPKRADSKYGFSELAGSGVAFKLVQALQVKLEGLPSGSEKWLLDLAAFGTVCDVVPLIDENRVIASFGLQVWPKTRWPGLKALSESAGVDPSQVKADTLGFVFGPRLNAAGRIEHAKSALALLSCDDQLQARKLASKLEAYNQQRRSQQAAIERRANELADQSKTPVIVLADKEWSHGIVGIVASKLMQRLGKPVFLAQIQNDGIVKGSARSYGDFSAAAAIAHAKRYLLTGGGHKAAVGFSLKKEDFAEFAASLNRYYRSLKLTDQERYLQPNVDLELHDLSAISLDLIEMLSSLEPHGQGNPPPLFLIGPLKVETARRVGQDQAHLKLQLSDADNRHIDAIMFRTEGVLPEGQVLVVAELSANHFNGRVKAELLIKSWRSSLS